MPSEILSLFESHGLLGLVVGSLVVFVLLFIAELRRKDKSHSQFIKTLLDDSKDERRQTNESFKQSTDKLSDALNDLSSNLRNTRN